MASLWFYKRGEKEVGPIAYQELVDLLRAGKLTGDDRVRRELSPDWGKARDVIGLVRAATGQTVAGPPPGPASEKTEQVPAARQASGVSPPPRERPAAGPPPAAPGPARSPRRLVFLAVVVAAIAIVAGYCLAGPGFSLARLLGRKATLREDFSASSVNLARWEVQQVAARVGVKEGELRTVFSPNRGRTSTVGLVSRFPIEGDFEIRVDYRLIAAEPPKKGNEEIKADICIEGPDGKASVMRGMRLRNGEWYACWADRTANTPDAGLWNETETKDRSGSLCLRRSGDQLSFLAAGPSEELRELDSISYGLGPIEKTWLRIWVPSNEKPVDISFDNLQIEASRLPLGPPGHGRLSWGVAAVAVALTTAAGAAWYWSSRR